MCLAVPLRVCNVISDDEAIVELESLKKKVNIGLVSNVKEGDYLIIHTGFAIKILDQNEAIRTLKLFDEIQGTES